MDYEFFGGKDFRKYRKDLVLVVWKDHYSGDEKWTRIKDHNQKVEDVLCETVGYLLYEDDEIMTVALTITNDETMFYSVCILKKVIVERIDFYV